MIYKKIFVFLLLTVLVFQIGFALGAEGDNLDDFSSELNLEEGEITATGIQFLETEDRKIFAFQDEGAVLNLKGFTFENIESEGKSGHKTHIITDNEGKIIEAHFTSKGGIYTINGVEFEVPANSEVTYSESSGFLFYGKNTKIKNVDVFEDSMIEVGTVNNLEIANEFNLSGYGSFTKDGFLLRAGEVNQNGVSIERNENLDESPLIVRDPSIDLSGYEGSWVRQTENKLEFKSSREGEINLDFSEENEFFNLSVGGLGPNEERTLNLFSSGGDSVEISKDETDKTKIFHSGDLTGDTRITTGKHIFNFDEDGFSDGLGNLNTRNFISTPFSVESPYLKDETLFVDDDNGYLIRDSEGNSITFDKARLAEPEYEFESEIGEKIYSFAEDKIGNSAFVWGGRGEVYYDQFDNYIKKSIPLEDVEGFDCIGLTICALTEAYPESSIRDFPPNLELIDALEEKGWVKKTIGPAKTFGKFTEEEVKNTPAGSIEFLMHPSKAPPYAESEKGISYIEHTNKKGEKIYLRIGHLMTRGHGDKNHLNAIPKYKELIPRSAKEYNDYLISQGKDPLFQGSVKEGNLVPQDDYLIVMSPPED